jgi:hypothetical protein
MVTLYSKSKRALTFEIFFFGCGAETATGVRDRVAPVLIERKTVEDVAASIFDGRCHYRV